MRKEWSDGYTTAFVGKGLSSTLVTIRHDLKPRLREFEAIVVSGLSGIIPGAIVAARWKKNLVVVRKDEDQTHGARLEGTLRKGMPYIVLDDFIALGGTMRRIYDTLRTRGYDLPLYTMLYDGRQHYQVPMVKPSYLGGPPEQLNRWFMYGHYVEGTKGLFRPYPTSDDSGYKENPDLWRPHVAEPIRPATV